MVCAAGLNDDAAQALRMSGNSTIRRVRASQALQRRRRSTFKLSAHTSSRALLVSTCCFALLLNGCLMGPGVSFVELAKAIGKQVQAMATRAGALGASLSMLASSSTLGRGSL